LIRWDPKWFAYADPDPKLTDLDLVLASDPHPTLLSAPNLDPLRVPPKSNISLKRNDEMEIYFAGTKW
jgi:hypothetical protein